MLIAEQVSVVRCSAFARNILGGVLIGLSRGNDRMDIPFHRYLLVTLSLKLM